MKLHHLAVQVALCLCVLGALNLGVAQLAVNSVPRQLLQRAEQAEPATDMFLGNSTMAAGLDEAAFAATRPGSMPLNLGLGATRPVEHYLVYRQQQRNCATSVYYGFLDTQLTDPPDGGWDALFGNRAMGFYIEPEIAANFYFPDSPTRRKSFLAIARVPILVERAAIWEKVERLRRFLGEIGLPRKKTNRFGRAEDFALLEAEPEVFALQCRRAVESRTPLAPSVVALLDLARSRGATVTVVEMPVSEQHRRRFYGTLEWTHYRNHIIRLVHESGAMFVGAADWVGDEGFSDNFHLNSAGASAFSVRLGSEPAGKQ